MKSIRIKITFSDNTPTDDEKFSNGSLEDYMKAENNVDPEVVEYVTSGLFNNGAQCELLYKENQEFEMGESTIKLVWSKDNPSLITVMRSGEVETVLTFEKGRRYISTYNVQGMAFEICTRTIKAENHFDGYKGSSIYLDYIIEIHGAFAGRRKMKIEVL